MSEHLQLTSLAASHDILLQTFSCEQFVIVHFLNHPEEMCPLDDKVDTNAAAKTCRAPGAPVAWSHIGPGSQESCSFSHAREKGSK